ncbi:HlyD family efflux transporter periplasmic adaptor subunit [Exilibacterium tricleocarpae]|uniref:HlyD family efflux transporter periplasmic adaptor subunit n=1 Tax=Exilibacterium tricleocarpae TaxID=2591008 RepID=A0A545TZP8_9GAMM|nr:HlyD family secretion protein [Exilibacterium tricleocarpae]TQV82663.1 HlyD family efflux transporter periplasmic adaptor subunit [Exilibacterium tricleocarpae]
MSKPQDQQGGHTEPGENEPEPRSQQKLSIYDEDDVPFQDLSQSTVKRCLYLGMGIVAIVITSAFVITVPREIQLPFEYRGGLREVIYQYPEKIYLLKAHIDTGETVSVGTPLATITSEKIVQLIQTIDESRRDLELYQTFQRPVNEKGIELLRIKRAGVENRLQLATKAAQRHQSITTKELQNLRQQAESRRRQYQRNQSLHTKSALSDQALEQSQISLLEAEQLHLLTDRDQHEETMANAKLQESLKNELALLEAQLQNAIIEDKLQAAQTQQRYDLARQRLQRHYGPSKIAANSITLKSSVDGTVSMRIENESEIAPQEYLLRLQAGAGKPYAYAESPSSAIGLVKKGHRVVLRYDAFPHYYYGTMTAEIDTISSSPSAQGQYPIRLSIRELNRLEGKVINGMRGMASITVEEKPIMDYLLRAFLKHTSMD